MKRTLQSRDSTGFGTLCCRELDKTFVALPGREEPGGPVPMARSFIEAKADPLGRKTPVIFSRLSVVVSFDQFSGGGGINFPPAECEIWSGRRIGQSWEFWDHRPRHIRSRANSKIPLQIGSNLPIILKNASNLD